MGPAKEAILQVHPTRRCNLSCLHCYSSSGPDQQDLLPPSAFERVLTEARSEGFRVASFSGGEPTLYAPLPQLLRHARSLGMGTTVTSNGMLLSERLLASLAPVTNILAISLDGVPESHNQMRSSPRAFEQMERHLPFVRASGIPFGFIFTLTQFNLNEAAWAAEFAASNGASLFQVHPLEQVGRAAHALPEARPDDLESAYAYLEIERIRDQYAGRMNVQFDLVHATVLRSNPELFLGVNNPENHPLAELVSPLVVEPDGRIAPFGYGFASRYSLGNITQASLSELADAFRGNGYHHLQALCRSTFEEASKPRDLPILNWWERLGEHAQTN